MAGAYPGFHSMKPEGVLVLLLPSGLDASLSQGYPLPPPSRMPAVPFYTPE